MEPPGGVADDQVEVAVAVEVAGGDDRPAAEPEVAALAARSAAGVLACVAARPGVDGEDPAVGGAVDQLDAAVAVEVGGDDRGPVVGQEQGAVAALERPRLHQDRRALAAEVAVDADQSRARR